MELWRRGALTMKRALYEVHIPSMKTAGVYHSGDYGAWIVPSGKIYRVEGYQEHEAVLLFEVFPKENVKFDENSEDFASYKAAASLG